MNKIAVNGRQDIFLVRNFLAADECLAFIALSEGKGYEGAMISTAMGAVVARDVRNNDRLIWDDKELAVQWWERAKQLLPPAFGRWQAAGLNECQVPRAGVRAC